jgi:hypothetical protein
MPLAAAIDPHQHSGAGRVNAFAILKSPGDKSPKIRPQEHSPEFRSFNRFRAHSPHRSAKVAGSTLRGHPPSDWNQLVTEARAEGLRLQQLAAGWRRRSPESTHGLGAAG